MLQKTELSIIDECVLWGHVDSLKQRHNNPAIVISKVAPELEGPTIESATQELIDSQLVSTTPRVSQPLEQSELLTGLRRLARISRPPQRYTVVQS